jgi:hypothetical protein
VKTAFRSGLVVFHKNYRIDYIYWAFCEEELEWMCVSKMGKYG